MAAKGKALLQSGLIEEAGQLYGNALDRALKQGDWRFAARFSNNLGTVRMLSMDYRGALSSFLWTADIAKRNHLPEISGISGNLSSLFFQLGDIAGARHAVENGLKAPSAETQGQRTQLLTQYAWVLARMGDLDGAITQFHAAIAAADQSATPAERAQVWDHLGGELLRAGRTPQAEHALLEAYRIRTLNHDRDLRTSLLKLSQLKAMQGDLGFAWRLMSAAFQMPARDAGPSTWNLYQQRARLLQRMGQHAAALDDLRRALDYARDWREAVAPSDAFRTGAGSVLNEVYEDFITAALNSGDSQEAFVAAEEQRAASLLQELGEGNRRLPPEYRQVLDRLRMEESRLLVSEDHELRTHAEELRHRLSELEARYATPIGNTSAHLSESFPGRNTLSRIQGRLRPDEALLSFHVGNDSCVLWTITTRQITLHRLSGRAVLRNATERFEKAAESGAPERIRLGKELYFVLFSDVGHEVEGKQHWLLTADDAMFSAPLAATVVAETAHRPVYLIQRHAIRILPSAALLAREAGRLSPGTDFLGIADPVYNRADNRFDAASVMPGATLLELPRLTASASEIEVCARAWGGATALLTGREANSVAFENGLRNRPGVIHIAGHVIHPPGQPMDAVIHLGLKRDGGQDLLTRFDVRNLSVPGSTVVMSGCTSATAVSRPGAGVLGLTRAWLMAGAGAVIGSRWPVRDEAGVFFGTFYSHLRRVRKENRPGAAESLALQATQSEMINSATWRADPAYWAAYYVIGKE